MNVDKLAMEAAKATAAGMSYGRWKATQPIVSHIPRKIPNGYRLGVCKECGSEFMTNQPKKVFCDDTCRGKYFDRAYKMKAKED